MWQQQLQNASAMRRQSQTRHRFIHLSSFLIHCFILQLTALGGASGVRVKALNHESKKRAIKEQIARLTRTWEEKTTTNNASLVLIRKKTLALEALDDATEKQTHATTALLVSSMTASASPHQHQHQQHKQYPPQRPPLAAVAPSALRSPFAPIPSASSSLSSSPSPASSGFLPIASPLTIVLEGRGGEGGGAAGDGNLSRRSSLVSQIQARLDSGLKQ